MKSEKYSLQENIFRWLDLGSHLFISKIIHSILIITIFVSIFSVVLQTEPALNLAYSSYFHFIEFIAICVFTLEYLARMWVAPLLPNLYQLQPWQARFRYAITFTALIDFATIIPFYLDYFFSYDLTIFVLFRLFRFLKLARYSPGFQSLLEALRQERRAILGSTILLLFLLLFTSTLMYLVEGHTQPLAFGSIPRSMWWSIVTLSTLGYGDVVPHTWLGRIIAGITAMSGFMLFALPVGIVASAFSQSIRKRDFLITWGLVARVPLFAELDAKNILDIMRYLRSQTIPSGGLISRKGEIAQCMYIVASGRVEVKIGHKVYEFVEGQFFGERALLENGVRAGNAIALEMTQLLILDKHDFEHLLENIPSLGEHIKIVMKNRLSENS